MLDLKIVHLLQKIIKEIQLGSNLVYFLNATMFSLSKPHFLAIMVEINRKNILQFKTISNWEHFLENLFTFIRKENRSMIQTLITSRLFYIKNALMN